ncbi:MAG: hypothetical protein U9N60_06635 [Thermodesulfobacteriota bacterium]|nr:hypothetical protein [Thermodesulfobacteriota bacterium]
MLNHKLQTKIYKKGYLELRNLPFMEGTQIEIVISKKKKKKNLQKLICNDHVWAEEDIKAVERGRGAIQKSYIEHSALWAKTRNNQFFRHSGM